LHLGAFGSLKSTDPLHLPRKEKSRRKGVKIIERGKNFLYRPPGKKESPSEGGNASIL